jgi:hypothetical protein
MPLVVRAHPMLGCRSLCPRVLTHPSLLSHVMERESFESEAVAALLNADFVPIKVDREERPDVDRVYMAYVQATQGGGGWPMSVWLTPTLHPFLGGTYFPAEECVPPEMDIAASLRVLTRVRYPFCLSQCGRAARLQVAAAHGGAGVVHAAR